MHYITVYRRVSLYQLQNINLFQVRAQETKKESEPNELYFRFVIMPFCAIVYAFVTLLCLFCFYKVFNFNKLYVKTLPLELFSKYDVLVKYFDYSHTNL